MEESKSSRKTFRRSWLTGKKVIMTAIHFYDLWRFKLRLRRHFSWIHPFTYSLVYLHYESAVFPLTLPSRQLSRKSPDLGKGGKEENQAFLVLRKKMNFVEKYRITSIIIYILTHSGGKIKWIIWEIKYWNNIHDVILISSWENASSFIILENEK